MSQMTQHDIALLVESGIILLCMGAVYVVVRYLVGIKEPSMLYGITFIGGFIIGILILLYFHSQQTSIF